MKDELHPVGKAAICRLVVPADLLPVQDEMPLLKGDQAEQARIRVVLPDPLSPSRQKVSFLLMQAEIWRRM
ncbi:MAG: hypothetical protein V8K32_12810 [Candidatus Electrothrix gigas]